MIEYSYPLYRPPAEANNIIIQVTNGCSYNKCTFCPMYKTKKFSIKSLKEIFQDIDILSETYPNTTKIFLADGDALTLDTKYLLEILEYLNKTFQKLRRVSVYATAQNLLQKTDIQLKLLSEHKLNLIYFGIETGSDSLLKKIDKGVDSKQLIVALNKATNSGMKVSATVILGVGGKSYFKEHIEKTAYVVNSTKINYLSTLQLGLEDSVKDRFYKKFDNFEMCDDKDILKEQKYFLELLNPKNKVIFRSNHASNALHLKGTLPKDKQRLIDEVQIALELGEDTFVPKFFRGF
jgi:radical SAM superfamily enzyme YgiQ (UPF0313 family)